MKKLLRIIFIYIIVFCTNVLANEDFFKDAKNLFDQGKFEECLNTIKTLFLEWRKPTN